jgi:PD-(D/E)XK nuclease superfamily
MKISNTQMADFTKCQKKFYFAQVLKLRPLNYPASMSKGIFGHSLMEVFFKAMQEGKTYDECVEIVNAYIQGEIEQGLNPENLLIYRHVLAFGAYAFQMEWRVISVEESTLTPEPGYEDIVYAYTPDVVFQWTRGPRAGSFFMLDHKFTGQVWNDRELGMYQQLFRYMIHWNMEHPTQQIHHLGVVCLLTRAANGATGSDLYTVKWLKVNREKTQGIQRESMRHMERVAWAKANYKPEDYLRTTDSYNCKLCYFADDICPADLEGKDISRYISVNYEVNTYFDDLYGVEEGEEMNGVKEG